ncbi:MAG: OmpA family protein [Candidatus Omnitrophica bacterium]|nr:OmpA family protein [Candidatus Omnitrophota bacterium]
MRKKRLSRIAAIVILAVLANGCTFIIQKGRRSDVEKIEKLSRQLDELAQAKRILEERLSSEIGGKQVRLEMAQKGLVITFLADILFDSGKAKIKAQALPTLDKVAEVLKENVPNLKVGIEGHTDNQPIKRSGWKSNWQLSTERALSVLYYLTEDKGIAPGRLSAIGYGEYHPIASNDTKEGRQLNRRVEVVIIPPLAKVKELDRDQNVEPKGNFK